MHISPMRWRIRAATAVVPVLLAILSTGIAVQGQQAQPPSANPDRVVVLVSLGGFRWDYAARFNASHILSLGKRGAAAADGMLPSFPSSTWPNAWTLVTGLYPGHHGIIADRFFDPKKQASFSSEDPKARNDGAWYGGVPLWTLAEKQGIRAACISWPGCTAEVAGGRPSLMSSAATSADEKIRQISAWLKLPETKRPRLITAYFPEVDVAGRRSGPDSPQMRAAVQSIDSQMGQLISALDATHLPIDLVIVSDHGMSKAEGDWINLNSLADLAGIQTEGTLLYAKNEAESEHVYNELKKASADFIAYRLKNAPAGLHLAANPRAGDPVVELMTPTPVRAHGPANEDGKSAPPKGVDGLNGQTVPEMKAIFYAAGPDIVEGRTLAPFENVDVYPWIAHLLGLTVPKNDGSLNILSGTLRDNGNMDQ